MFLLKHSTASQVIPLGFYLDSTDGDTAETGLTIANTDLQVWKTGATSLVNKNSGGATHMSIGVYQATLDATDTNTLGPVKIYSHVAGALVVVFEGLIVPVTTYAALITNGLNNLGGTAQTADHTSAIEDIPTNSEFNARTLTSASYGTLTNQTTINNNVLLIPTTPMRGTDLANTVTPPTTAQIWAEVTRELTSGNNIALAKGVGLTGLNDIAAIDVLNAGDVDGFTLEESQKLILAANTGVLAGAATTTVTIQAADGSKTRLTATVDVDGNRSAVIKDATG